MSTRNSDGTMKGFVNYTSRDYESLMQDFWDMVPKLTEVWKPTDDYWKPEANADPGVVLGKWLASIADMLGVNLDWLANEIFAPSVSQRKNAERLFSLIGYELGWYTSARTELTITNRSQTPITLDFGFNGANFSTVNAYTDITNQARVITYNILPLTNKYGAKDSRSRRTVKTENINVFADSDKVTLMPGKSVTRVAVEGELRSYSVSVQQVKKNNYIINIPSQHIDTTLIWIKARASEGDDEFLQTQWIQCTSPAEFVTPEPRFAVTYDSYSNAQIQISNYLNQLENYENNYLTVYWIDSSGVIGCVGEDVLSNYLQAKPSVGEDGQTYRYTDESGDLALSNLSNTVELPHTHTVTGKSPETAKEAYFNSRNYINTFDSLVTLPDFNRFLNREPGVDCGLVIDCQKALELNMAVYNNENLTDSQKQKMFITNYDFPQGDPNVDWTDLLSLDYSKNWRVKKYDHIVKPNQTLEEIAAMYEVDYSDLLQFNGLTGGEQPKWGTTIKIPGGFNTQLSEAMTTNFKTYTAMCFCIHNDFKNSQWGQGQESPIKYEDREVFKIYKPPIQFIDNVKRDYRPLQAMSVELEFGYVRVFPFYIVGQIYPKNPVSVDVGNNIIAKVKEDLALYFAPANRNIGQQPTMMEVVNVIRNADSRIDYFDAGSLRNPVINWHKCDVDHFNAISFARYIDGPVSQNIRIAPEYLTK